MINLRFLDYVNVVDDKILFERVFIRVVEVFSWRRDLVIFLRT